MHSFKLLSLGLMASVAIATDSLHMLFGRQVTKIPCSELGEKDCGSVCIPLTYTCCAQQQGGCPLSQYCVVGSNGLDGCCDIGQVCVGEGGTNTHLTTLTSTSTSFFTETSSSTSETTPASASTESPISTPEPTTSTSSSTSLSSTSFVEAPPTTTSSSNATVTKPPVEFTGGADGSLRVTSAFPVLGALFAALFMF